MGFPIVPVSFSSGMISPEAAFPEKRKGVSFPTDTSILQPAKEGGTTL
jgi:hypothetical protein